MLQLALFVEKQLARKARADMKTVLNGDWVDCSTESHLGMRSYRDDYFMRP